jgi:hypothetical protein
MGIIMKNICYLQLRSELLTLIAGSPPWLEFSMWLPVMVDFPELSSKIAW